MDWKELDRLLNWHRDLLREALKPSKALAEEARRQQELMQAASAQIRRTLAETDQLLRQAPASAAIADVQRVVDAYRAAVVLPSEAALSAARAEVERNTSALTHAGWQQMAKSLSSAMMSFDALRAFETTFQGQLLDLAGRFESAESPAEAEGILGEIQAAVIVIVQKAPLTARERLLNLLVSIIYPLLLFLADQTSTRQDFSRIQERLAALEEEIHQQLSEHEAPDSLFAGSVIVNETTVFREPDSDSQKIATLPRNAVVSKVGQSGEWVQIEFLIYPLASSTTGWVLAEALREAPG